MTTITARIQDNAPKYRELIQELSQEQTVKMGLESCLAERQRLAQKLKSKKTDIVTLEENSKKEFDDLRKIRHLTIKSAAATLTGKKREKIAASEARYQHAFEAEQSCKRDIEQMTNELDVLANNQDQLERQANHMRETRTQLNSLLDNIFSVSDSAFPLEPQLKAELQNYINQQIGATRDLGRFKDTDHNLTHAKRDINKVLRLLDTAMSYVPFDLFGGNLMDAHQAACLEGAKKQTYEVQRRLNVARQILPEIPHPGLLDVVTQNLLLNMQLNLNYVDVAWKAKAQHTYALLVTCQKNIETSLRWVRHYLHYTEGALQRLEVAIESTQNALEIERRRIVDGILAGQSVDGLAGFGISGLPSSPQEQGPQVQIDDQPPPMYESPPDANINNLATIPSIPSNVHLPPPSPTSTLENINSPALTSTTSLSTNNSPSQQLHPPSQPPAPYTPPSPTTSSSTPPDATHINSYNPFR